MNHRLSILFFLAILCSLAACKQNYVVPAAPADPPKIDVVNATADTLDYFINGIRQNNTSDIYSGGATNYVSALFGTGSYSFRKAGNQVVLFKQPYTLDTTTNYSLFVCGETAANTFLVKDNLAPAQIIDTVSGMTAVRFVNASPDSGKLDIVVNTGNTVNLKNCAFKSVSSFYPVKDSVNEVKIYVSGTSTPIYEATFSMFSVQPYTIFTSGTQKGKGAAALKAILIANGGGY